VTVIDLGAVLDQPTESGTPGGTIIITEYYGRVLGYLVRNVMRIVNLDGARVMPPPPLLGERTYMTAVTSIDDALVEIIDIERVLADIVGVSSTVTHEVQIETAGPRQLPRHVFVADDSAVARKQIASVLTQIGVTYEFAENGRLALDKLRAHAADAPIHARFGMLLSDIEMPVMDGYTLTRMLKADPALQGLYICLHTSLSGSFNQAMAASVGADRLMPKFDPDELAREVTKVMTAPAAALPVPASLLPPVAGRGGALPPVAVSI
jgi:two-component system chemotaxis response regulator CheV